MDEDKQTKIIYAVALVLMIVFAVVFAAIEGS